MLNNSLFLMEAHPIRYSLSCMDESLYRRRRLRLGALLFRLRYYMQAPEDIASDIYRYSSDTFVQVTGEEARLVCGDREEIVSLEEAIAHCKAALDGAPLHGA